MSLLTHCQSIWQGAGMDETREEIAANLRAARAKADRMSYDHLSARMREDFEIVMNGDQIRQYHTAQIPATPNDFVIAALAWYYAVDLADISQAVARRMRKRAPLLAVPEYAAGDSNPEPLHYK